MYSRKMSIEDIMMAHWNEFGRNFFTRCVSFVLMQAYMGLRFLFSSLCVVVPLEAFVTEERFSHCLQFPWAGSRNVPSAPPP